MTSPEGFKCLVADLDSSVDNQMLLQYFEPCEATNAKVERDQRSGKSAGFGHVWFRTEEALEEAVLLMNGTLLAGSAITVQAMACPSAASGSLGSASRGRKHSSSRGSSGSRPRMASAGRRGTSLGSKHYERRDASEGRPSVLEPATTGSKVHLQKQKSWSWLSLFKGSQPLTATEPKDVTTSKSDLSGPNTAPQPGQQEKKAGKSKDRRFSGPLTSQSEGCRLPKSRTEMSHLK